MSSFSLVISPPDALQPGFTENTISSITQGMIAHTKPQKRNGAMSHYAPLPCIKCILSFGSWLEPRYIFAAGQLN
jgi:hypothetical protein